MTTLDQALADIRQRLADAGLELGDPPTDALELLDAAAPLAKAAGLANDPPTFGGNMTAALVLAYYRGVLDVIDSR